MKRSRPDFNGLLTLYENSFLPDVIEQARTTLSPGQRLAAIVQAREDIASGLWHKWIDDHKSGRRGILRVRDRQDEDEFRAYLKIMGQRSAICSVCRINKMEPGTALTLTPRGLSVCPVCQQGILQAARSAISPSIG
jgi:hypothetical protein